MLNIVLRHLIKWTECMHPGMKKPHPFWIFWGNILYIVFLRSGLYSCISQEKNLVTHRLQISNVNFTFTKTKFSFKSVTLRRNIQKQFTDSFTERKRVLKACYFECTKLSTVQIFKILVTFNQKATKENFP